MGSEKKHVIVELIATVFLPPETPNTTEERVMLSNVHMPSATPASNDGLTLLYGFSGTNKGLMNAFAIANSSKKNLHIVTVKVPLSSCASSFLTLAELPNVELINTRRITKELSSLIALHFTDYAKVNHIANVKLNSINNLNAAIAKYPLFLDHLIKHEDFKHIHVISYPVYMPDGQLSARANLYKRSKIKPRQITCQSLINAEIVLPDRLARS